MSSRVRFKRWMRSSSPLVGTSLPLSVLVSLCICMSMSAGVMSCVADPAGGPPRATGGQTATGGRTATGGNPGSAGVVASGGAPGTGGALSGSGGADNLGSGGGPGASGTGGLAPTGTGGGTGGNSSTGGQGASATGGTSAGSGGAASGGGASGTNGNIADAGTDGGRDATAPVDQTALPNITVYLAGDSTVMTYAAPSAQEGWGQELGQLFISKVTIDNQAIGGASVKTFMYSDAANTVENTRWARIHSGIKAGDYLLVQFGANDSGNTADRHVDPPDFQALLGRMADAVKAKQATPILVTPSALQEWSGGRQGNVRLGPYAAAMRSLAPMKNILVADLNARSVEYLNMIGQTAAMQIYINGDKAHFTKTGAIQMARFVADELRRIGSPLAAYLK